MKDCDYDILIVGGGPAGSSCAWGLRHSGFRVAILDKADFPRHKVCAGWITPQVLEELDIDLAEYASTRTLQPISNFRTGLIGKRSIETRYDRIVSYGIRRCEFDDYLLRRSGAELLLGQALTSHQPLDSGDGWRVNQTLSTRLLIGAGGHFCPLSRSLNPSAKHLSNVVLAQELEFPLEHSHLPEMGVKPDTPELYFSPDLAGYGWCFLKGNHLNIGLGRRGEKHLTSYLEQFLNFLQDEGRIPRKLPVPFQGHAYALHQGHSRTIVADRLLLLGDAAGLAYPESGEGIRPAVESGLLAADVICKADGDFSRNRLATYERLLEQRFGSPNASEFSLWSLVPERLRDYAVESLLTSRTFTRRVILDRWFLHRRKPPLKLRTNLYPRIKSENSPQNGPFQPHHGGFG